MLDHPLHEPGHRTSESSPKTFHEVWAEELETLETLRRMRGVDGPPFDGESLGERAYAAHAAGLAFSGGGIRSATFNLGVTQALAKLGILRRMDYLSTVSGGGYVGAWLTAWIRHQGFDAVERRLPVEHSETPQPAGRELVRSPVSFLRSFSNYLTPRLGLFSADTWTAVATYGLNLILNLLVLVSALAAILLVPRLFVQLADLLGQLSPIWIQGVSFGMAGLGIIFLAANALAVEAPPAGAPAWFTSQKWVQILVVVPLFLCAWLAGNGFWFKDSGKVVEKGLVTPEVGLWAIKVSAVVTCFWFVAWILHLLVTRRTGQASRSSWGVLLVTAPFAGALYGILDFVAIFAFVAIRRRFFPGDVGQEWSLIHVTVLGAPAFVGIVLLGGVLHIGLMGRDCVDASREWWNRLGGWLIIYCITWLGISAMAFYVPVLVLWIGGFAASVLSAGWLVTSVGGLLFDRLSADDGPLSESKLAGVVRAVLPQFFVVGLLAVLAFALHAIIDGGYSARQIETVQKGDAVPVANVCRDFWPAGEVEGERNPAASFPNLLMCHSARTWLSLENRPLTGLLFLVLGFGSLLLSWRVDINQFSMHYFYRNRLIRAYLGASNPRRRPQSFTGFDPEDDFPMADLLPDGPTRYDGPLHLVNANLNLVQGAELAWQQRKGASFVFTPLSTGFAGAADTPVSQTGFRPTREYKTQGGGISLGMAMAISGAAVSPSMGEGTTAAMSFLLTVFDARLGWWLGNPLKEAPIWKRIGPDVGLFRLLAELFGATNDRSNYVYLSDGGHFDNLGIYELVRRRCRLIVASDGGADTDRTFGCLANAIRKCRNDFGVPITIDLSGFRFGEAHRFSDVHCAVGRIHYDAVDPDAPEGTLLFLKATLTGDEPADVLNYKAAHPDFPNQSTTDQFFDEAQFESYRALGYHTAKSVFRHLNTSELSDLGHAELCDALEHAFCQDEDEHDEEARKTVG